MNLDFIIDLIKFRFQKLSSVKIASLLGKSATYVDQYIMFLGFHGPLALLKFPNLMDTSNPVSGAMYAAIANFAVDNQLTVYPAARLFKVSPKTLKRFIDDRQLLGKPLDTACVAIPPVGASITRAYDPKRNTFDSSLYEGMQHVTVHDLSLDLSKLFDAASVDAHSNQSGISYLDEPLPESDIKPLPGDGIGRSKALPNKYRKAPPKISYAAAEAIKAKKRAGIQQGAEPCPKVREKSILYTTDQRLIKPDHGISAEQALDEAQNRGPGRPKKIDTKSKDFDKLPPEVQIKNLMRERDEYEAQVLALKKLLPRLQQQ